MKIGFIAIGGAGDNILNTLSYKMNIRKALTINTNITDFKNMMTPSFLIHGANGVAQDRELAKSLFDDLTKNGLITRYKEIFKEEDIIFILFSSGGGTGSGLAPIITKTLFEEFKETTFVNVAIAPNPNSPTTNLENSGKCLSELYGNQCSSIISFQNGEDITKSNADLIEHLLLPFHERTSINKNIDGREVIDMFKSIGFITPVIETKKGIKNPNFLKGKEINKICLFADNVPIPEIKNIPKVYDGDFENPNFTGIFKLEYSQEISMDYFKNLRVNIENKKKLENHIKEDPENLKQNIDELKNLGF